MGVERLHPSIVDAPNIAIPAMTEGAAKWIHSAQTSPRVEPALPWVAATATIGGASSPRSLARVAFAFVERRPMRKYAQTPTGPDQSAVTGHTTSMIHIFCKWPAKMSITMTRALHAAAIRDTIARSSSQWGSIRALTWGVQLLIQSRPTAANCGIR